jgi:hypothetical protein
MLQLNLYNYYHILSHLNVDIGMSIKSCEMYFCNGHKKILRDILNLAYELPHS